MPNLVVPAFKNLTREEFWRSFIAANDFRHLAEIGVWRGGFASYLLRHCGCIESYTMVDAWRNLPNWNKPFNVDQNEFDAVFKEAMNATDFAAAKRIVKRGTTLEVISEISNQSLDFVYVDGDHTLRGVVIDLLAAWGKVREGGVLAGDDFTSSIWQHGDSFEPTMVNPFALYFAEATNSPITILPHNQFFIHKDSHSSHSVTNMSGAALNHSLRLLSPEPAKPVQASSEPWTLVKFAQKAASSILWRTSRKYREAKIEASQTELFPSWIKGAGCLFIHIPKTAGTSISLALYGRQISHVPLRVWINSYPKSLRSLVVFTVIRDPVQRFVSAFWFLKKGGMNSSDLEFSKQYLSAYETPEQLALALVDPKLQSAILAEVHFRPQSEFLETSCDFKLPILFIPMEHLRQGIARLSNQLGSKIELPHLNKSEYPNTNAINPEAMEILLHIYKQDSDIHKNSLMQFR